MPNTQNTDYNQQIQAALANQSTLAEELKKRYTDQPAYEAGARASIFGGDQGLKDLTTGFSNKVMELYNYDKERSTVYNAPFTTESGMEMPINPMIEERAKQGEFRQTLQAKEDAWKLLETRKNVLGDALDKAVKAYEAETKGKEVDRVALKDQISVLVDMYKEENRKAEEARDDMRADKELDLAQRGEAVTGNADIDELSDAQAVSLAEAQLGLKFTGGTIAERGARAKQALDEAVQKGSVSTSRYLDQLPTATQGGVSSLADIITRANELSGVLAGRTDISGPIVGRTSKFLADIIGTSSDASMYGKELEEMSADKIKERYGGALTTTEVQRLTKQAITGRNIQEASNVESLAIMKKNARSLIEEKLRSAGWKQQAIDQYLKEVDRPPLSSFDK